MAKKSQTVKSLEAAGLSTDFLQDRPNPMPDMTQEQGEEWQAIVNRMADDWFPRESHQLLAQYCRHECEAKFIAGILRAHKLDPDKTNAWLEQYGDLLKLQEREGRAMSSLATRLRITQQSTVNAKTQKPPEPDVPWDFQ